MLEKVVFTGPMLDARYWIKKRTVPYNIPDNGIFDQHPGTGI